MRYFSDFGGQTVELIKIFDMPNKDFAARFPAVICKHSDSFHMFVGYAEGSRDPLPLTRNIDYKRQPSKHECDARCVHATGKVMKCECSCGGKNHGKGH